jgi:S1-C subfamily serine protease
VQPDPKDYSFNLDDVLAATVLIRAAVPGDAFTAETLGTERAGNGVIIRGDGLVLTIGYLVTEAESIWITLVDGRVVPGHVLAFDQETGFGLIQALARLDVRTAAIGRSADISPGEPVIVAGGGGIRSAVAARVVAKHEFAGYWEYVLDEAIFTAPAHPNWGGTAVIGPAGELVGIGSLLVQQSGDGGSARDLNMVVPIDLLPPILDDLVTTGRANRPPRPWLGIYATELAGNIVIADFASRGPGATSDLRSGDIVLSVAGRDVGDLADFFRSIWGVGEAGCPVPLVVHRDGRAMEITVQSGERRKFLKSPVTH